MVLSLPERMSGEHADEKAQNKSVPSDCAVG
jgi:hypothetical protein